MNPLEQFALSGVSETIGDLVERNQATSATSMSASESSTSWAEMR